MYKFVYLIKTTLQKFFIFGYVAADKLCFQFMQKKSLSICEEHTDHMTTSKIPISAIEIAYTMQLHKNCSDVFF